MVRSTISLDVFNYLKLGSSKGNFVVFTRKVGIKFDHQPPAAKANTMQSRHRLRISTNAPLASGQRSSAPVRLVVLMPPSLQRS